MILSQIARGVNGGGGENSEELGMRSEELKKLRIIS